MLVESCVEPSSSICSYLTAVTGVSVHQLLVIQAVRPDRVLAMVHRVVGTILGENFMHDAEQELNLASAVETEVCTSQFGIGRTGPLPQYGSFISRIFLEYFHATNNISIPWSWTKLWKLGL